MTSIAGQLIPKGKNKWLVRIYLGTDLKGKRSYYSKTINGTKKEAQAYLNKLLLEKDTGTFNRPTKLFVTDLLSQWLNNAVKQRVRDNTFHSYKYIVNKYIEPYIGKYKLSQLTPALIQEFYSKLLDTGISSRTVRYAHTLLKNALDQAIEWEILTKNPANKVTLPRQQKNEMKCLSPKEAEIFINAIVYSKWKALFSLLLTSGMRPGEALGLKWQDFNFNNNKVTICRTLVRVGVGWSLEEPKTRQSRRTIPIPPGTMQDIKEHQEDQLEQIKQSSTYNNQGFVFANGNGDPLVERNIVSRHFKPILEREGLPNIRLYDLRHTCATLLLYREVNPKIVSERLGHASTTLTMDIYSHVLPDMQQEASDKLQEVFYSDD